MKTITAIIRPNRLSEVKDALRNIGIEMMTVTSVMGCGREDGTSDSSREDDLLNKTRLEIMVADDRVTKTVDAIMLKGRTGNSGDGKIFVMNVPHFFTISTGS